MSKIIKFTLIAVLITLINGECDKITPDSRFDCFAESNGTHLCCLQNSADKKCVNKEINPNFTPEANIDCGIEDSRYKEYEFTPYRPKQDLDIDLQTCGRANPEKKKHCTDYSSIMNSCCLFQKGTSKGCFYLGKKYSGNSDLHKFKGEKDEEYSYECKGTILSMSIFLSFWALLLILF